VMNVAGHRLSTFEIESALVDNSKVAEAAVVSRPDALKGEGIVAFVTLRGGYEGDDAMVKELREHVSKVIGPIAKPDNIVFTPDLPKTRSGKIMRRLLRDVARGNQLGDVTTLANAEIVDSIHRQVDAAPQED
jgi:acetyl-CoA synthetase